jgi:Flp pilus assembly protein TadB
MMNVKAVGRPSKGVHVIAFVFLVFVLIFLVAMLVSYPVYLAWAIVTFACSGIGLYYFTNRPPRSKR